MNLDEVLELSKRILILQQLDEKIKYLDDEDQNDVEWGNQDVVNMLKEIRGDKE